MRCREVEVMWDEIRGDCKKSLKEAVHTHLGFCPGCQSLYEEFEGVAYHLSSLPEPEASCDLSARVIRHIATLRFGAARTPIVLSSVATPIGPLYVGFKEQRIAYIGIDTGETHDEVRERVETRLRRPVEAGPPPEWLVKALARFFQTWRIDDRTVDISDLTDFEQATLRATAQIPPGEVRSYGWVATQIGRPRAARAVGRVMARNPLPVLFPCHRVVDAAGDLHHYGYGLEMKAKLLRLEGYRSRS